MKTTWKKWRVGLWLTLAIALFTSLIGLGTGMSLGQWLSSLGSAMVAGLAGYIQKSPIEEIQDK